MARKSSWSMLNVREVDELQPVALGQTLRHRVSAACSAALASGSPT